MPSSQPSLQPSTSSQPSSGPSANPSQIPSSQPSNKPSPALTATITAVASLVPNDDILGGFQFGASASISGMSSLIGAPNPNTDDTSGAAYLFENFDTPLKKIPFPATPLPDGSSYAECGASVALSNEYAVIGCPGFTKSSNGNKVGAVLIYSIANDESTLLELESKLGDDAFEFGTSVSLNVNGILAVGSIKGYVALYDINPTTGGGFDPSLKNEIQVGGDTDTTIVALNDIDPPMLAVGVVNLLQAFLYRDIISTEERVEILPPNDANCASGCSFGFSVALFEEILVVGSPSSNLHGSAFVYDDLKENGFADIQSLPAIQFSAPALFGQSVAITDGAVVVGSPKYSSDGTPEKSFGAAFFYNKNEDGDWYLPDFDSTSAGNTKNPILGGTKGEQFGDAVAISDTAFVKGFVVGAPFFEGSKGEAVAYSYTSAKNP
eukprot:scaffold2991_cov66-Skeletonema_marinoi.AAC.1